MMINEKPFLEKNSPMLTTNIHDCIVFSKDGNIIKIVYIEDSLSQSTLIDLIENQIELAKQHEYILKIEEYCFQMEGFPRICYIKYNCKRNAQSLSQIFKDLVNYSEDFKRELNGKLKRMYEYIEDRNLLHKNLKPSNIIYWDNELWLTDFESLKVNFNSLGLNLSFNQKLNCFPYLCDKFFQICISPDYLDKMKKLTPQDYQEQNQYAIQIMRLRLFSDFQFNNDQETDFYLFQYINELKKQLSSQELKFQDEQLKKFQQQLRQVPINDIQQSNITNQIELGISNQDIRQGELFIYYFNYIKVNEENQYENKIIKFEPNRILISSKNTFSQGIEIIKNSDVNSQLVVHYKNIKQQDKHLIGDNCEITWYKWNKLKKIFEVQQRYVGQFKDSKRNGIGKNTIIEDNSIIEYNGEWVNDQKQGKGIETKRQEKTNIIFSNFDGFFENNLYHGQGKIETTANNETISYEGKFYSGKKLGVFIYNKRFQNGRIEKKRVIYKKYCCCIILFEQPIQDELII